MALRGMPRFFEPHWLKRLVLGGPTTAPDWPPLHIKPTAAPTKTAVAGDIYVTTDGALAVHNGTDFLQQAGEVVVQFWARANGEQVDQALFIANRAWQVTAVREIHSTAGTDASAVNLQVTKDTGTNAPGAGTDLLTNNSNAGFDLKGTANTVQVGTLTATVASLQLAAGDRLSVDYAGVVTALVGVVVTVTLKAI